PRPVFMPYAAGRTRAGIRRRRPWADRRRQRQVAPLVRRGAPRGERGGRRSPSYDRGPVPGARQHPPILRSRFLHTYKPGRNKSMPARHTITANVERLETLMDEAGLDAVVLRSGQNFTYLSGVVYPGTLARHQDLADSLRAVLLVWPRRGAPVIIANK